MDGYVIGLMLRFFAYGAFPGIIVGAILGFSPRHVVNGLGLFVIPLVVVVAGAVLSVGQSTLSALMPVVWAVTLPLGFGFVSSAILAFIFIRLITRPDATEQG